MIGCNNKLHPSFFFHQKQLSPLTLTRINGTLVESSWKLCIRVSIFLSSIDLYHSSFSASSLITNDLLCIRVSIFLRSIDLYHSSFSASSLITNDLLCIRVSIFLSSIDLYHSSFSTSSLITNDLLWGFRVV